MFLVYSAINDILVVGNRIVDELEWVLPSLQSKLNEGSPDDVYVTPLDFLLLQQRINILKLARSVKRLRYELEVISPDAYIKLIPILEGKSGAIMYLIDILSSGRLTSAAQEDIESWIESRQSAASYAFKVDVQAGLDTLSQIVRVEDIENIHFIPANKHDTIERYLQLRKPREVLNGIEVIANELRQAIADNFSLQDILLNVGDRRAALPHGTPGV